MDKVNNVNEDNATGLVLEIQRMSTEDGPGLRTTVFLKGCPLKCKWCHNPESISANPYIQWTDVSCIHCKTCLSVCKQNAVSEVDNKIRIDENLCTACGACVKSCPTNAMEIVGKIWSAGDLAAELLKDRSFFEESNGGITISGGEALVQSKFAKVLLKELKKENIHTAIDTCGMFSMKNIDEILDYTDLILYDLKEMDPKKHSEFTGADNRTILDNLDALVQLIESRDDETELWIRTPIIPGATDSLENVTKIAEFISDKQERISKWELCAFNNLCKEKYRRLGIKWEYENTPLMHSNEMDDLLKAALQSDISKIEISWSGMTEKERIDD